MADLLITATSGLRVFQQALNVTGHNVANVNTDGYSRQRTEIVAATPQLMGSGYVGSGSRTESITRVYQDYLTDQLFSSYSFQRKFKTADEYSVQLNANLGDPETGLFSTMQGMYQSWNIMANDPATNASSRVLLQSGQALQQQVQAYRNTRTDLHNQVNGQMVSSVTQINQLTQDLIKVNQDLGTAAERSQMPPNDLLDHRDMLVKKLNQYMDIKVFQNDKGIIDVYSSDGKVPLITDNRRIELYVDYNPMDKFNLSNGTTLRNEKQEIWIQQPGTGQRIMVTDNIKSGELAGATSFRKDQFSRAEDELGLSLVGMAIAMNAQHRQGFDKAGVRGSDLFLLNQNPASLMTTAKSYANLNNTGSTTISTSGTPTSAFAYKIVKNATNDYNVTDAYTGAIIAQNVNFPQTYNGVTVTLGGGASSKDDVFEVYTTTDFHASLEQEGYVDYRNAGTLKSNGIKVNLDKTGLSSVPSDLSNPADYQQVMEQLSKLKARTYDMRFDGTNYTISDKRTGEVIGATATTVGTVTTLKFEGLQVKLDTSLGSIKAGDHFEVRYLSDGVIGFHQSITNPDAIAYRGADNTVAGGRPLAIGNNVNAANLASMQDKKMFLNGTDSTQGTYSLMAGNVGSFHQLNLTNMKTQDVLYSQLNQQREAVSGVNLDEEAANMMKFQQAYQAAAQIMQASQKMFDAIISVM